MRTETPVQAIDVPASAAPREDVHRRWIPLHWLLSRRRERREGGNASDSRIPDRRADGRYKLNMHDINEIVETAVGGKVATTMVDGQMRFGVVAGGGRPALVSYRSRWRRSGNASVSSSMYLLACRCQVFGPITRRRDTWPGAGCRAALGAAVLVTARWVTLVPLPRCQGRCRLFRLTEMGAEGGAADGWSKAIPARLPSEARGAETRAEGVSVGVERPYAAIADGEHEAPDARRSPRGIGGKV